MSSRLNRCFAAILFAFVTCVTASATDLPLVGDVSVNSTRTTTTAGTVSNLYCSSANNTFLQFDSTQVPTGTTAAQVSKATLLVFVNRVNTAGPITVSLLSSAFAEGTVTYATQPTIGASQGSFTTTNSSAGQYIAVDVTAAVKGWITTPSSNYGLALTTSAGDIVLDSKENDQTAHPAKLDVTLSSSGGGTTLSAGTAAGQVYLTGASGAVPTTPVTVSGDAVLSPSGSLLITSPASLDIISAINSTYGAGATISPNRLATNSGTATTFLNGSGSFAAPIVLTTSGTSGAATFSGNTLNIPTPAAGGGLPYGGTAPAVIATTASTLYLTTDSSTITLPAANTAGQQLVILDSACSNANPGFTLKTQGTNTIVSDSTSSTSLNVYCSAYVISTGGGKWIEPTGTTN